MNLIIVNPTMDDFDSYVFGVCSSWVRHLAPYFDKVFVITFKLGEVELPNNVEVFEVKGKGQINKLTSFWDILGKILKENEIGAFFSHMEQNASMVATPLLRWHKVPHFAWYARESHGLPLKALEICADHIVTSSPQGCRINSKKVIVLQQGIDTEMFKRMPEIERKHIITVGRVSRVKYIEKTIEAYKQLRDSSTNLPEYFIIGENTDEAYALALEGQLETERGIWFLNMGFPYKSLPKEYNSALLYISSSMTGSLDKTILEALACEVPVVVCCESLMLDDDFPEEMRYKYTDTDMLAKKMQAFISNPELREEMGRKGREYIIRKHSLSAFSERLANALRGE